MLVLSRKIGERLVINDNIVVTIVRVRGDRVQLGIKAPPEVPIRREEIIDQLWTEACTASATRDTACTTASGLQP